MQILLMGPSLFLLVPSLYLGITAAFMILTGDFRDGSIFFLALPFWFAEAVLFLSINLRWLTKTGFFLTLTAALLYIASTVGAYLHFHVVASGLVEMHERVLILGGPMIVAIWNLILNRSVLISKNTGARP